MNQKQMAGVLAVGQTTYSDYELGKLNIPIPILIKLAQFHGVSIDYLLGLTEVSTPYPRGRNVLF